MNRTNASIRKRNRISSSLFEALVLGADSNAETPRTCEHWNLNPPTALSAAELHFSTETRSVNPLPIASDRIDDFKTLALLVNGMPETQYISAVVGYLESPESIARIGQFPMHGNLPAYEFCV